MRETGCLVLTQLDVRALQLAKAAVAWAIEPVLAERRGRRVGAGGCAGRRGIRLGAGTG